MCLRCDKLNYILNKNVNQLLGFQILAKINLHTLII